MEGLVAGLAGGLAGTIAMGQFQNGWQKASKALQAGHNGGSAKSDSGKQSHHEAEDAAMKAAGKLAAVAGYKLTHEEKKESRAHCALRFRHGHGSSLRRLAGSRAQFFAKTASLVSWLGLRKCLIRGGR